ncbi:MAG TPA: hypothetical protein VFO59_02825 [Dehalococcoidia bacterium]|nr:hypothetical protein [Dehalococcoidia bacterium]
MGLKKRPHDDAEEEQPRESRKPLAPLPPVLNVLVPDIAGVTSFHLRQFYDTAEARAHIQALPSTTGLHAFWGLHAPPAGHVNGEGASEAMVLIRSADASDTVYVVSFVDLESADSFARFEAKRGMNLGSFLIYWAEIVNIEAGENGVQLTPEAPPRAGPAPSRLTAAPISRPTPAAPSAEVAPPPPRPAPASAIVEEPPSALTESSPNPPAVPEPQPEPELVAPEPEPVAKEVVTPEPVAEEVVTPEPEPVSLEQPEPVMPEPEPAAETGPLFATTAPEPVAEAESRIEVQFVARPPEAEPVAEAPAEREPEAEPVAPLETAPANPDGDEDMDIEREAAEFLKASGNGQKTSPEADPWQPAEVPPAFAAGTYRDLTPAPNGLPVEATVPETDDFPGAPAPVRPWDPGPADEDSAEEAENSEHRVQEVEKILNVKRWDKKDSPFRGFDSPPGRF